MGKAKAAAWCKASIDALTEQRELDMINHASEIRKLHASYALKLCRRAQLQAEEAELSYRRLQVFSVCLCGLSFIVGVALGVGICLMNLL